MKYFVLFFFFFFFFFFYIKQIFPFLGEQLRNFFFQKEPWKYFKSRYKQKIIL